MKRLLSFLCVLILSVLPLCSAMAETLDEWNRSCRNKTSGKTTVYFDPNMDRVVAVIPANTYVRVASRNNGWAEIGFRTADGRRGTGVVRTSDICSAVVYFVDEDGDKRGMQELEYYDLYGNNPPSSSSTATSPAEATGSTSNEGSKSSGNSSTTRNSTAKQQTTEPVSVATHEGESVTVTQLGVHTTAITKAGKTLDVPTASLTFAEDVPADKAVAVIHAPRTGKCTLRQKASASAKSLGQCKAGAIVPVLEYGSKFCKISYDGEVGYVLTSCLKFYGEADEPIGTGVLTYSGKATGKTTINIRNAADSDAYKIAQWHTGTTVTVFGQDGNWYEIEYDGIHGFVLENYLTISE